MGLRDTGGVQGHDIVGLQGMVGLQDMVGLRDMDGVKGHGWG